MEPKARNDGHLFDYTKLSDNIYIGSDLCKGMVCPVHGVEFEALGILVELNLSVEKKEIPPDGIDVYTWIPVADGYPPSPEQMDIGSSIINEAVSSGKKVFVHCKNGHARSPTMVAAYLVRFQGETVDEAIELIKSRRRETHIEENQIDALNSFAKKWSK